MNLSTEDIDRVREMSAALLPPSEIAILLGLTADERDEFVEVCKNHRQSDIYMAYQQGRLETKYELRRTVIRLAKAGSPAAEPLADAYLREQSIKE